MSKILKKRLFSPCNLNKQSKLLLVVSLILSLPLCAYARVSNKANAPIQTTANGTVVSSATGSVLSTQQQKKKKTISGTILDAQGEPVIGASVYEKGASSNGTVSDVNGKFTLSVTPGSTLQVSYIGYKPQSVVVGAGSLYNITLIDESKSLDEVVVVAYGTQKRKDLTGSLTQVDSKLIGVQSVSTVTKALEGQVPGLQVASVDGQPGRDMAIRVRGLGSANVNSSGSLVVIDGVPVSGNTGTDNPLASINSDDIASVTVLKDAASTAIYGSRGANGVVLITTKRGQTGKTKVSFKGRWGINSVGPYKLGAVENSSDYYEYVWRAIYNSYRYGVSGGLPGSDFTTNVANPNHTAEEAGQFASQHLFNYIGSETKFGRNELGNLMAYKVPGAVYTPDGTTETHSATMTGSYLVNPDGKINPNAQLLYDETYSDYLLESHLRQEYEISASGGTEKMDYFLSLGYLDDPSYVKSSSFKRYSGRANLNSQLFSWLRVGTNIGFSHTKTRQMATSWGRNPGSVSNNIFYFINGSVPIIPVHALNEDGSYRYNSVTGTSCFWTKGSASDPTLGTYSPFGLTACNHSADPIYAQANDYWGWKQDMLNTRSYAEITFLDGFDFKTTLGYDRTINESTRYYNGITGRATSTKGGINMGDYNSTNLNLQEMLSYNKDFGKHHVDAMLTHEYNQLEYSNLVWGSSYELISGLLKPGNFVGRYAAAKGQGNPSYGTYKMRMQSYLGRANYVYDDKYYVSASIRRDGSSKFHKDRWGTFWSVGGGWRISAEKFMESTKDWLDNLKVRASYGVIGNANGIGIYSGQTTWNYGAKYAANGGTGVPTSYTLSVGGLVNDALTWENTHTFDCGIDMSFLGRVNLTFDFYNRNTVNSFYNQPVSLLGVGQETLQSNSASIRNRGIELELSVDVIKTKDLTWNISTNGTHYTTELTDLGNYKPTASASIPEGTFQDKDESWSDEGTSSTGTYCFLRGVGRPWYNLYLYKYLGVDQNSGLPLYGHRVTTAEEQASTYSGKKAGQTVGVVDRSKASKYEFGSAIPKWIGGFSTTVKYKDFDFSAVIAYQLGGKFYSVEYGNNCYRSNIYPTDYKPAKDMIHNTWTPENKGAKFPMQWYSPDGTFWDGSSIGSQQYTDLALFSASYMRLKNLTLGYTLPKAILDKIHISTCRFFVSADNLFFLSAKKGMDPSMSLCGGFSVGAYGYPTMQTISFGVNVDL